MQRKEPVNKIKDNDKYGRKRPERRPKKTADLSPHQIPNIPQKLSPRIDLS